MCIQAGFLERGSTVLDGCRLLVFSAVERGEAIARLLGLCFVFFLFVLLASLSRGFVVLMPKHPTGMTDPS